MATSLTTTVLDHTGNAGFQAWSTELYNQFIAAGFTQSADTGQLATPVVAARPSTNTAAGYWIFYINDSLHGSRPIYMKIEVGTAASANSTMIWLTVGSSTNGSGTISGTSYLARSTTGIGGAPASTVTNYPSYVCRTAGFAGMSFKTGAGGNTPQGFFTVGRTVDDNGAITTDGVIVSRYNTSVTAASLSVYSHVVGTLYTEGTAYCFVPANLTTALTGGNAQFFKHYIPLPAMRPLLHQGTVLLTDVSEGSTFTATQVGATSHTYVVAGKSGAAALGQSNTTSSIAFLWE